MIPAKPAKYLSEYLRIYRTKFSWLLISVQNQGRSGHKTNQELMRSEREKTMDPGINLILKLRNPLKTKQREKDEQEKHSHAGNGSPSAAFCNRTVNHLDLSDKMC
ncbi:hypothetical protein L873DRAFT_787064 [Choiromyces venosus 120613-1]|uniref:Uncharacterized protein n=1 Tax=Choiromyces venosus 120613-1 TaxID=1336337 RepID=A0A3N4K466_9PEZI|nr:hypothetical protein L873DRAFT_787064 [Choiromyces venosus 120613-1]